MLDQQRRELEQLDPQRLVWVVGDARRETRRETRRATRRRERRAATARGARARVYVTTPRSVHVATPHSTWYVPRSTRSCRQTTTIVLFSLVEMRLDDDASERTQQCFVRAQDVSRSDEITMICKFLVLGGAERNISGCVVTVMVTARFSFYLGVARQRGDVERGAHEVRDDVAVDDVGVALRRGGGRARANQLSLCFVVVNAMASGYDTAIESLILDGPARPTTRSRAPTHSSPPWRDRRTSRRASA